MLLYYLLEQNVAEAKITEYTDDDGPDETMKKKKEGKHFFT
jgi:hypothetical protein